MGMYEVDRILVSKLRDALDVINAQLEYGYIDLGQHDELELLILRNALADWEKRVLEPRERKHRNV